MGQWLVLQGVVRAGHQEVQQQQQQQQQQVAVQTGVDGRAGGGPGAGLPPHLAPVTGVLPWRWGVGDQRGAGAGPPLPQPEGAPLGVGETAGAWRRVGHPVAARRRGRGSPRLVGGRGGARQGVVVHWGAERAEAGPGGLAQVVLAQVVPGRVWGRLVQCT